MRKEYLRGEPVETIYFGGGTPSQLAEEDFLKVFETIRKYYGMEHCREITLEANPDDLTEAYAAMLQKFAFQPHQYGDTDFRRLHLETAEPPPQRSTSRQCRKALPPCRLQQHKHRPYLRAARRNG